MKCQCGMKGCATEILFDVDGGTMSVEREEFTKEGHKFTHATLLYLSPETAREMIEEMQEYLRMRELKDQS